MKPASTVASLQPSAIRRISDGAPADAIPLGLGEPTWELPEPARRALAETRGVCGYGLNVGLPELRASIGAFTGVTTDEVLVTNGSQEALFVMMQAWLDPGDQVLLPDPGFVAYPAIAQLVGAEIVRYGLSTTDRFRLDADAFVRALNAAPRAKLALLNVPSNPTGAAGSLDALRAIADACRARGVLLVSDEVYRDLYLERRAASVRDVAKDAVVIASVSKGFAAPGLRVGWAVGPVEALAPAKVVHAYATTAAARPSQLAAKELLDDAERVLAQSRAEIARRFDALRIAMRRELGREALAPDGSFYYWIELPTAAHADPFAFCLRLRDEGKVVLIPGLAFGEGGRRFARLSFAAKPEQIDEGVRRLAPYWRRD
jgi:aspartate/methionine/tyrosine aminotransferase